MKLTWLFLPGIVGICTLPLLAQTKTITNFELEKFRTQRVQAEKDLRENYEKLGFSSPEERARRDEAQRKDDEELAARFERERLEREAADAEARSGVSYSDQQTYYQPSNPSYLGYGSSYYPNRGRTRFRGGFRQQTSTGYFAGGAFWPGPSSVRQPMLVIQPRVRPRH